MPAVRPSRTQPVRARCHQPPNVSCLRSLPPPEGPLPPPNNRRSHTFRLSAGMHLVGNLGLYHRSSRARLCPRSTCNVSTVRCVEADRMLPTEGTRSQVTKGLVERVPTFTQDLLPVPREVRFPVTGLDARTLTIESLCGDFGGVPRASSVLAYCDRGQQIRPEVQTGAQPEVAAALSPRKSTPCTRMAALSRRPAPAASHPRR